MAFVAKRRRKVLFGQARRSWEKYWTLPLQLILRDQGRRLVQFWSLSPGTRLNSPSLLVTRVSPADLA